jgi:hypothetical protein
LRAPSSAGRSEARKYPPFEVPPRIHMHLVPEDDIVPSFKSLGQITRPNHSAKSLGQITRQPPA